MKKVVFTLSILLMTLVSFSQESRTSNGFGRSGGGNPRMKEMLKQKLADELKLTESQSDSVATIQMESQKTMRDIKMDSAISQEEKENKLTELKAVRNKKLKAVLTDEQIGKLQEMVENMRKNRGQKDEKGKE